jgi:hypothetical protein
MGEFILEDASTSEPDLVAMHAGFQFSSRQCRMRQGSVAMDGVRLCRGSSTVSSIPCHVLLYVRSRVTRA